MSLTAFSISIAAGLGAGALMGGIATGWLVSAGLMAWKRLGGAVAAGLMGLAVSIYLGLQHNAAAGESICNVSSVFDCDTVNRSAWSEIAGIPIAFLGAAFYAGVVVVGLLALQKPATHPRAGHVLFGLGVVSLLYSAFLAVISAQMGVFCLLCISLYGVNLLITVAGFLEARKSGEPLGSGVLAGIAGRGDRSIGVMVATGLLALVGLMAWYNTLGDDAMAGTQDVPGNPATPEDYRGLYAAPGGEIKLDGTEPILGNPSAPFTLVEYADFECPYCGRVFPELHELVEKNPDLRLMFKHYPISSICNDQVDGERHALACGAAAASECARQQGRFWELSSAMFKNQQYLAPQDVRFMAEQGGLDLAAYDACMADPRAMDAVRADVAHAHEAGISGTPTLFLHGVVGDQWVKVEGPEAVTLLLGAARKGMTLPPPR